MNYNGNSKAPPSATYDHWTPQLVQELLYRQFVNHEDVSSILPPQPKAPNAAEFTSQLDDTLSSMYKFCNQGPVMQQVSSRQAFGGASSANNNVSSTAVTPNGKPHVTNTVNPAKGGLVAQNTSAANTSNNKTPRTPKDNSLQRIKAQMTNNSGFPQAQQPPGDHNNDKENSYYSGHSRPATPNHINKKRSRQEFQWPAGLPTDDQLKPPPPPTDGSKQPSVRSMLQPLVEQRIRAQDGVDPDFIFRQTPGEFPIMDIFKAYPSALRKINTVRGLSGDWRNDTFTVEDERRYKQAMRFNRIGPSQALGNSFSNTSNVAGSGFDTSGYMANTANF